MTGRYSKLFRGLDTALHNRIHELDKPVIRFCEQDITDTLNRVYYQIASVPVNQTESLSTSQAIAAAHVKHNAQALIAQMTNFLTTCKQQSAQDAKNQVEFVCWQIRPSIFTGHLVGETGRCGRSYGN